MTRKDIRMHIIKRRIRMLERVYRFLLSGLAISVLCIIVFTVKLAITDQGAHGLVVSIIIGLFTIGLIKFVVDKQYEYECHEIINSYKN
tara:strand:- start:6530 stop:6796 length:267 start_codon:yes stop_codon:yes gene_type:complete